MLHGCVSRGGKSMYVFWTMVYAFQAAGFELVDSEFSGPPGIVRVVRSHQLHKIKPLETAG